MNQSPHSVRRAPLRLPAWQPHAIGAALLLALGLIGPIVLTHLVGDPEDAHAGGEVAIAQLPETPALSGLDNELSAPPDLLAGEVAPDENPTESMASAQVDAQQVDALGNPKPASSAPATTPAPDSSSRTIRIDGVEIAPQSLPPAPFPGLTRAASFGDVPTISSDGDTAFKLYARPFKNPTGEKPVAVVLGGLGVNPVLTRRAIDTLPADVSLSFAAHARNLQTWVDEARAKGHEVWLELPMEAAIFDPTEPGADRALRITGSMQDNQRNLDWALSRAQGFVGVINYNGDAFLQRADATAPLMDYLSKAGLGMITDGSFKTPTLPALAGSVELPFRESFGLIDPEPDLTLTTSRLSDLGAQAGRGQRPIGVGFAYPSTIEAIDAWARTLSNQGLILVPVSAIVP